MPVGSLLASVSAPSSARALRCDSSTCSVVALSEWSVRKPEVFAAVLQHK